MNHQRNAQLSQNIGFSDGKLRIWPD